MDNPSQLEAIAERLRKGVKTYQDVANLLRHNDLNLSQSAYNLTSSGGNLTSWQGQSAIGFLNAWSQCQQDSNKCASGLDRGISCFQGVAQAIEDELPTLRTAWAATQQTEDRGVNQGILKAIEQGQSATVLLASVFDMMTQQLEEAAAELGRCSEPASNLNPGNIFYNSEQADEPVPEPSNTNNDNLPIAEVLQGLEPYPNLKPEDLEEEVKLAEELGVTPAQAGTPEFEAMLQDGGQVKWVITKNGELWFIPKNVDGTEIAHAVMTNGDEVLVAGDANIVQWEMEPGSSYTVLELTNQSGHYQPASNRLEIAKIIFEANHIAVPDSSIQPFTP